MHAGMYSRIHMPRDQAISYLFAAMASAPASSKDWTASLSRVATAVCSEVFPSSSLASISMRRRDLSRMHITLCDRPHRLYLWSLPGNRSHLECMYHSATLRASRNFCTTKSFDCVQHSIEIQTCHEYSPAASSRLSLRETRAPSPSLQNHRRFDDPQCTCQDHLCGLCISAVIVTHSNALRKIVIAV